MQNQKFNISLFSNNTDTRAKEKSFDFNELYDFLKQESKKKFEGKNNLGAIVCGTFLEKKRTTGNISCRSIISYDIDYYKHNLKKLTDCLEDCLKNYSYIYYTTSSNTFDKPKLRLLLPICREIIPSEYETSSKNIAKHLLNDLFDSDNYFKEKRSTDSALDRCSYSPSYLMYLPTNVDNVFKISQNQGRVIQVDNYLGKVEYIKNFSQSELNHQPLKITQDEIKKTLDNYNPTELEYADWLEVIFALHHQYNGDEIGLKILIDWSLTDIKINEKERYQKTTVEDLCTYKYQKLSLQSYDKLVTFSTIIFKSNRKHTNILPKSPNNNAIQWDEYSLIPWDKGIFVDLKKNNKGETVGVKNTFPNFEAMCRFYKIDIAYDVITKDNINSINEKDHNSFSTIIKSLSIKNGMEKQIVPEYIYLMGKSNQTNTIKIIMDGITWDGKDRIKDFFNTVEVDEMYEKARDIYLLKWLKQSLYLVLHEGERKICRNLLVFQSDQKAGKSTWVNNLLPKHLNEYIGEGLRLNLNNSTDLLSCLKKWYVELAELEQSFKITDINQWKAFFGRRKDELNIKYVATPVVVERTTSFIGTVNEVSFLKDKSGSTRFLVLPVKKLNGYHGIDMLQLKKQIIETLGYTDFELNDEECAMQRLLNEEFEQPNILEEQFFNVFENEITDDNSLYTTTEIFEQMGYSKKDINRNMQTDLANILRKYGFKNRKNIRCWKLKLKSYNNFDDYDPE